ncbi:diguanylate cyclase [Paenibacillus psychroresistens]|uniref:Diguanylate cyclase n=1 Tax=Paenibacillus psychroresistens TaxID=1778678 RepID=A0A6B8RRE2_9BACL|nr:diguanylate cyclase [Paenibacillus psychroresistens]QGQ98539.1 diguanylate cyclase [Paenibacillus psychroresistens]
MLNLTMDQQLRLYAKVIENTLQAILITDIEGKIIYANGAFLKQTGYELTELYGQTPRILKSGKQDNQYYHDLWETLLEIGQWQGELWNRDKNGRLFFEQISISAVKGEQGDVAYYVAISTDITTYKLEREKLEEVNSVLQQLSSIDGLTSIANRRYFDENLEREWRRAIRKKTELSLIMIDIDYFKSFNDTYGHLSGDECIKTVAQVLNSSVNRPGDLAARFGGEEFIVLLPDTELEGAMKVARSIRATVEALQIVHAGSLINDYVTVSLGVATISPGVEQTAKELVYAADQVLYEAKQNGRNRISAVRPI